MWLRFRNSYLVMAGIDEKMRLKTYSTNPKKHTYTTVRTTMGTLHTHYNTTKQQHDESILYV